MPNPLLAASRTRAPSAAAYGVPQNYPAVLGVRGYAVDQNGIAVRPAGHVNPAGLIDSIVFQPCQPGETQAACDARVRARISASGSAQVNAGARTEAQRQQDAAMISGIAGAAAALIGTTGQTILAAIQSGNQTEIARLNNAAQERIAQLNTEASAAASAAQREAAQQQLQMMMQLQAALAAQQQGSGSGLSTGAIIGLAVAGVAALGGVVYLAVSAGRSRANPVVGRGRNRHFVAAGRRRRRRKSSAASSTRRGAHRRRS